MKIFYHFVFLFLLPSQSVSSGGDNYETLLKVAREKSASAKTQADLLRVKKYYESAIQISSEKEQGVAQFELSQLLFSRLAGPSVNSTRVFELLVLAASAGHPDAQAQLGAAYATGVHLGLVPMSAHSSILLQHMAALSGSTAAHMMMGYRYLHGLGVPESCDAALRHYEYAANQAVSEIEERFGAALFVDHARLSDQGKPPPKNKQVLDPELMDFYVRLAEEGDMQAAVHASNIFMVGNRRIPHNRALGEKYLKMAAAAGHPGARGQLGYLMIQRQARLREKGRMGPVDVAEVIQAREHAEYAVSRGDATGQVTLGLMHLRGIGAIRNLTLAMELFNKAQGKHPDAAFYMGNVNMGQAVVDGPLSDKEAGRYSRPDMAAAGHFYVQAAQQGHPIALHRWAHMLARGMGMTRSCPAAVSQFKSLAEMGIPAGMLGEAHAMLDTGFTDRALMLFAQVAAMGVESAQANTAYLLSRRICPPVIRLPTGITNTPSAVIASIASIVTDSRHDTYTHELPDELLTSTSCNDTVATSAYRKARCGLRALYLYTVSARQGNADSYVRVGDTHYFGLAGLPADKFEAAVYYQMAADLRHTHAIFNLGMMHEVGDGVEQDFHLAKRFFDQAAVYDADAQMPRAVALAMLEGHKRVLGLLGSEATNKLVQRCGDLWRYALDIVRAIKDRLEGEGEGGEEKGLVKVIGGLWELLRPVWMQAIIQVQTLRPFVIDVFAELVIALSPDASAAGKIAGQGDTVADGQLDKSVTVQVGLGGYDLQLSRRSIEILVNTVLLTVCSALWIAINMYRLRRWRRRLRQQ